MDKNVVLNALNPEFKDFEDVYKIIQLLKMETLKSS
jgi:hypothetical protein